MKLKLFIVLIFVVTVFTGCANTKVNNDDVETSAEVEELESETVSETVPETVPVFITNANLNVRSGPGTSYDVVYTANVNETLQLTGKEDNSGGSAAWYEVKTSRGVIGWINSKYGTVSSDDKGNFKTMRISFNKTDNVFTYNGTIDKYVALKWKIIPKQTKRENFSVYISREDVISIENEKLREENGDLYFTVTIKTIAEGSAQLQLISTDEEYLSDIITINVSADE